MRTKLPYKHQINTLCRGDGDGVKDGEAKTSSDEKKAFREREGHSAKQAGVVLIPINKGFLMGTKLPPKHQINIFRPAARTLMFHSQL